MKENKIKMLSSEMQNRLAKEFAEMDEDRELYLFLRGGFAAK